MMLGGLLKQGTTRLGSLTGYFRPTVYNTNTAAIYEDSIPSSSDRVFVAMSSGVDSSTVAALLARQYPGKVTGIYMCNWDPTKKCTEAEWNDVQRVCSHLNIDAERVNFEKDYWTDVFEPMINMYSKGLTPNPDVSCNRHIKFGSLIEHLKKKMGADTGWKLATGHYARVSKDLRTNSYHLRRPTYLRKDQSYYLSTVDLSVLKQIFFPLATYTKPQVRKIAHGFGLPTADKPDSQGLCFVSQDQRQFKTFLQEYLLPSTGDIVTEDGKVVGKHQGLWTATIGQKSGVSMPQASEESKGVWYVSDKNIEKNQLVIVPGRDHPSIYSTGAMSNSFRWLGTDFDLSNPSNVQAQYRSLQDSETLSDIKLDAISVDTPGKLQVSFSEPRRALAPGQYLVLYSGDRVLGSGIIDKTL